MKLHVVTLALLAAHEAAGAALYGGAVDYQQLIEGLLQQKQLLPESSRRMLAARVQDANRTLHLAKREAQAITLPAYSTAGVTSSDLFTYFMTNFAGEFTQRKPGAVPPKATVPEVSDSPTQEYKDYAGAKQRKIRYGPYRIPPNTEANFESMILGDKGLTNTARFYSKKPCAGSCMILKIAAAMEYADGSVADVSNGAWFHHLVLVNIGSTVVDPICGWKYMENVFMSSKERNDGLFTQAKSSVKTGYHILEDDQFTVFTELMNMSDKEKWAWVTITYDYIDGEQPDYLDGKVIWQQIGRNSCGDDPRNPFGESNMTDNRQPIKMAFGEHSFPWEIPYDAQLLGTNGHMHDGATSMEIFHNDKHICTTTPTYSSKQDQGGMGMSGGGTAGGGMAGGGHSHGGRKRDVKPGTNNSGIKPLTGGNYTNTQIDHIEKQIPCIFEPPLRVKKGDKMNLVANYDFQKHPGMKNEKGELDEIMGIAGSMFALPYPRKKF